MPTGEHLRFHIGRFENGPAILPFCISFLGFTPIPTVELDKVLRCYPKMDDAELLSFGFKYGFKLHYGFHTLNLCILLSEKFKIEHFEDLHQQVV
jgi:hypothetical protein